MGLKCGIVGLPNVGKSTLFNALTASCTAEAANYPFCTIEPNIGVVNVPDKRLDNLAKLAGSAKIIPAIVELVDIAGLVAGASKGEGLGNKFLSHIRQVDAIIQVLRCFEDENVTHVHNKVDAVYDVEIINTELILADITSCEKRLSTIEKKLKSGDAEAKATASFLNSLLKHLSEGLRAIEIDEFEQNAYLVADLNLLTAKPMLFVCNVLENDAQSGNEYSKKLQEYAATKKIDVIIVSAKIESEIALLEDEDEKIAFMADLGLEETGLNKIIKAGYEILQLDSYFTIGPKEARAWTFKKGITAPCAAGIIHTDFEKGFIRAEVIKYEDYSTCGSEVIVKEQGKMRLEGKEYIVQDGDVIHFRFNV